MSCDAIKFSSFGLLHFPMSYLGVFVDREVDIALSDNTTTSEFVQDTSNTLFNILLQSRCQINVISSDYQTDVFGNVLVHAE